MLRTSFLNSDNAIWLEKMRESEELAEDLKQAISSSKQMPKQVLAELAAPAGFTDAQDELFDEFSGLPKKAAREIQQEILDSLTQPQGWSTDSIVRRIQHHWEVRGHSPEASRARAENVARTEVRSLASEFKRRNWHTDEAERQQKFKYHIRGANDHRTTKLSHWTRLQVPRGGLELEEMEKMLDEGVRLAKAGAFWHGGELEKTPGKHISLPEGFKRRGFLVHFNDRDQVFRIS